MVTQDPHIYTRPEIQDLERMIDQGNNGLHRRFGDFFHGLVGWLNSSLRCLVVSRESFPDNPRL